MCLAHLYDREMGSASRSFGLKPGWLDVLSAFAASELARSVLLSSGGTTNRLEPDGGGRARQGPTL